MTTMQLFPTDYRLCLFLCSLFSQLVSLSSVLKPCCSSSCDSPSILPLLSIILPEVHKHIPPDVHFQFGFPYTFLSTLFKPGNVAAVPLTIPNHKQKISIGNFYSMPVLLPLWNLQLWLCCVHNFIHVQSYNANKFAFNKTMTVVKMSLPDQL